MSEFSIAKIPWFVIGCPEDTMQFKSAEFPAKTIPPALLAIVEFINTKPEPETHKEPELFAIKIFRKG